MNTPPSPPHVYARQLSAHARSSLSVLAGLVPQGTRVLDLGTGSGALGRMLREQRHCRLDGVTLSAAEQALARPWYERLEVLDLEDAAWELAFAGQHYDVIVCADVLEHLRRPEQVLQACQRLLAPGGALLVSIPNASYAGFVASLMHGDLDYGREGLLDSTHLRFFTRRSFQKLLQAQGWAAELTETIEQPLHESEFSFAFDRLPPAVVRHLLAQQDASAYQLVMRARPAGSAAALTSADAVSQDDPISAATFIAQLFIGGAQGFSAQRQVTCFGRMGIDPQRLSFALPQDGQPVTGLRLDPADRPGYFRLHRISLHVEGQMAPAWEWRADEAGAQALAQARRHQLDVGVMQTGAPELHLFLLGDDPSVELPVPADVLARCAGTPCRLDVECGWPLSADYLAAVRRFEQLGADVRARDARVDQLEAALRQAAAAAPPSCAPIPPMQQTLPTAATSASWLARAWQRLAGAPQPAPPTAAPDPTVEIVVPIYGNLHLVRRCVESVLASPCRTPWHLTLINDASPHPEVAEWLADFAARHPQVTAIANARNLGFVQTVNLGMRLAGPRDVVLLNTDTEVANDWLDRLRAAAYSGERVGSVTPFSNNATICSYPRFCEDNPLVPGHTTASLDRLFARANAGHSVDMPTAVGFCMYIRRDCLAQTGEFDAQRFGAGYGEENDFCLRASALGWRHLHALDVFVFHEGGVSFAERRLALQAVALETIRQLHPGYEDLVRAYVQRDPARPYREAVDRLRSDAAAA